MEDIELVIKISEKDLQDIRKKVFTIEEMFETTQGRVYRAIVNGTPLDDLKNMKAIIIEIISEQKIQNPKNGREFYQVKAIIWWHGQVRYINQLFLIDEWERAKTEGYYMA